MTKRDDQVSLVDMLIYAEEAIDMLGDASQVTPPGWKTIWFCYLGKLT